MSVSACASLRLLFQAGTGSSLLSLRFLIDNALPPQLADLPANAGYDAVHVRAYGMQAAKDEQIVARAVDEDRIVVSADSDFGAIIAAQEAERPSFILFREPDLMVARDYFDALCPALPILASENGVRLCRGLPKGSPACPEIALLGIGPHKSSSSR
jgi:predicted nuclease of predicted toxin-antitoxin system